MFCKEIAHLTTRCCGVASSDDTVANIWHRSGAMKQCFQVLKFSELISISFLKAITDGNGTFRAFPHPFPLANKYQND